MCEQSLRYKADEPCDEYFGNVCSGFGGSLECYRCGWHKFDHEVVEKWPTDADWHTDYHKEGTPEYWK